MILYGYATTVKGRLSRDPDLRFPQAPEQAKATRRAILEAQRLFVANGYGATSIRAIAEEAGVAVQTVYAVFGNKRQLVIELVENAVTGDDDPAAVTERPEAQALRPSPVPAVVPSWTRRSVARSPSASSQSSRSPPTLRLSTPTSPSSTGQ